MTSGFSAYGTTLQWNGEALAELTSIGGPSLSIDTIELTSHDSTDAFREFVAGLRDGGDISIEGNFIPSDTDGQVAFVTDAKAGTTREVIITGPTSAAFTWTFDAIVTSYEDTYPFDGKLGFSATLKVTGVPVLAVTISANSSALSFVDSVGAKTPVPAYAAGTYVYSLEVATASDWVKVTTTHATAATIVATALGVEHVLTTTVQSEQITLGAADTVTELTIDYTVTGQIAKRYTIYVTRP
jgi:predicted secreted protein